jgi:hypothetical protein
MVTLHLTLTTRSLGAHLLRRLAREDLEDREAGQSVERSAPVSDTSSSRITNKYKVEKIFKFAVVTAKAGTHFAAHGAARWSPAFAGTTAT